MKKCSICKQSESNQYCYDCLKFMFENMYYTYPEQFKKLIKYAKKVLGRKK